MFHLILLLILTPGTLGFLFGGLPPILLFQNGTEATPSTWPARRAEIFSSIQALSWGTFPLTRPSIASSQVLNTSQLRGVETSWHRVTYATPSPEGCPTEVEVLRPLQCTPSNPCPAFFASKEHRRWTVVAVSRTYVGVSFNGGDNGCDTSKCEKLDGTRCFQLAYPNATFQLLARRAFLASLVLDFALSSLNFVNPTQVGLTGHSRNGKSSLFAGALDTRFSAIVDSSSGANGIYSYRLGGGEAQGETPASAWPGPWFLPSFRDFDGREHEMPLDSHSVLGLIAPRPVLLAMATHDSVGSFHNVEASAQEGAKVYDFLGAAPGTLSVIYRPGEHHGYEAIATYLDFFDRTFGREPSPAGQPLCSSVHFSSSSPGSVVGPFTAFNWSAWDSVNAPRTPTPAPSQGALQCVQWALGEAPPGPVWDPGGTYPPMEDLAYSDLMQLRDKDVLGLNGEVVRVGLGFGANVISGSLFYRPDMMTRAPPSSGGWPALVYLHGANYGKAYMAPYATDSIGVPAYMANNSFVVLTFEQLGFGLRSEEGANFYSRYPTWSKLGAQVADAMSAVDVLSAVQGTGFQPAGEPDRLAPYPRIDPSKIYLVGYGLGGAVALHAAAMDGRVAGVATVSGWTPHRGDLDDPPSTPSGGMRRWWETHSTQPRLGWYSKVAPGPLPPLGPQDTMPYDYEECVFPALSPRPVLAYQPSGDRFCSASQVSSTCDRLIANGYRNLTCTVAPGINAMDDGARSALLAWLQGQT